MDVVFQDWIVYGPYVDKKQNRKIRVLRNKQTKQITTLSNARYLLSLKEGRWLGKDEEADHINGDPSDDRIENLRILSPEENKAPFNATRETPISVETCSTCGAQVAKKKRDIGKYGGYNRYCNQTCFRNRKSTG